MQERAVEFGTSGLCHIVHDVPLARALLNSFMAGRKANMLSLAVAMPAQSCRVTIRDPEGIEHTAEVTAESLYEAIALGLKAIRESSWVEGKFAK